MICSGSWVVNPLTRRLPPAIRGSEGRLLRLVLDEHLSGASRFARAVGFFSVGVLDLAYPSYARFFKNGGQARFIFSPHVSQKTLQGLVEGVQRYWTGPRLDFPAPGGLPTSPGFRLLVWALSRGAMQCKIALPSQSLVGGLYHEKIGLFVDSDGSSVAYEGSANETAAAYRDNFERVRVYSSDGSDTERSAISEITREFEATWRDEVEGLKVLSLERALREDVFVVDQPTSRDGRDGHDIEPTVTSNEIEPEYVRMPPELVLRDYQVDAVDAWWSSRGAGVLSMATGSGKTLTALAAVARLRSAVDGGLIVIFVAPLLHLVDQWIDSARDFGLEPIRCAEGRDRWLDAARAGISQVNAGERQTLSLAVSNATFVGPAFQSLLGHLRSRTLLVADEVHNLGARNALDALPARVALRLGLSATPERWRDEEGSAGLFEYFGPVVFEFGLKEALEHEPPVLTPYRYYPVPVTLQEAEVEEFIDLSDRIGRIYALNSEQDAEERAFTLLLRRARLLGNAQGKTAALRAAIRPFVSEGHILVYVGDGSIAYDSDLDDGADEGAAFLRQIDLVTQTLGNELGMRVARYTAETSPEQRRRLTEEFRRGGIQALVAIRCLDEGVDIPAVRRAFILASSTNPRQFIQRRGRILRRSEGKTRSEIFDFIPVLPAEDRFTPHGWKAARTLANREMARVTEFADLAVNGAQARLALEPLLADLGLSHL